MPAKMQRYLRKNGDTRIYPWTELLGARTDMVEIFAMNPKEAAASSTNAGAGVKPDFNLMTRAQLFAYADAYYDVQIDPKTNRPELIAEMNRLDGLSIGDYPTTPADPVLTPPEKLQETQQKSIAPLTPKSGTNPFVTDEDAEIQKLLDEDEAKKTKALNGNAGADTH